MYHKITKQYADSESKGKLEKPEILVDFPILLGNYIQKAFSQHQQLLYMKNYNVQTPSMVCCFKNINLKIMSPYIKIPLFYVQ